MRVGEHLDLDVARGRDQALDEHPSIAESRLGLALRRLQRRIELSRRLDDAHPAPASTGCRLDQQRVLRRPCLLDGVGPNDRDAGLRRELLGA